MCDKSETVQIVENQDQVIDYLSQIIEKKANLALSSLSQNRFVVGLSGFISCHESSITKMFC